MSANVYGAPAKKIIINPSHLKTALEIWAKIESYPHPVDRWLGNFFHCHRKQFGSRDRRFLSETIYAAFRHKSYLKAWSRGLAGQENPELFILMAAFLGEQLTSDSLNDAIQSMGPKIPKNLPTHLLEGRIPDSCKAYSEHERLALRYSLPPWLAARWIKRWGAKECESLFASFLERPPLVVRANPFKITREKLAKRFLKKGWRAHLTSKAKFGMIFDERTNVFDSEEFREGLFEVQDEGSQIMCEKVEPKPGKNVWDVCAGGGGKALLLAALMQNKGRVIATDIRSRKLLELKKRAKRAGVYNIFPADLNRIGETREAKIGFDKILIDAPCSGTGTLRRNPDAKWKLTEEKLSAFHRDQTAILENALPFLKKGGRIYYVTCSIEPTENEEVIQEVLAHHPELSKVPASEGADGFLRLLPHRDHTDGFFLAVVEKGQ